MVSRSDLINAVAKRLDYLSEEDIKLSIDIVVDEIKENLLKGNRIEIRGFGSFSIRKRKYPGVEKTYNTVYYRMSKNILEKLNSDMKEEV